jgi:hypothetical protein
MSVKASISLEDAKLVHEFAIHVQPILRHNDYNKLLESARTVQRISFCCVAEARMKIRAERQHRFIDPYTTEVIE